MTYINIQDHTTIYSQLSDEILFADKSFKNSTLPYILEVLISDDGINFFEDAIKGIDRDHAIERAKRNWENIIVLAKGE